MPSVSGRPTTTAAAAWSWVEKMLHETQRTSAPSSRQRLDEHRRLDGHVQAAHDARAGERLARAVLGAQGHQPGHLLLGEADFLAAELGLAEIPHLEGLAAGGARRVEGMLYLFCQLTHARLHISSLGTVPRERKGDSPIRHSSFVNRHSSILLPRRDEQPGPLGVSRLPAACARARGRTRRSRATRRSAARRSRATGGQAAGDTTRAQWATRSVTSTRPPRASTRATSGNTRAGAGRYGSTSVSVAAESSPSETGSASRSPRRNSTLSAPCIRRRAAASIAGELSIATTRAT